MSTRNPDQPSFSDVYLSEFQGANTHAIVSLDKDSILVDQPWGRNDARLRADLRDQAFIDALNTITINPKFEGIFHTDTNEVELAYAFLDPESEENRSIIDRDFIIYYSGKEIRCRFAYPTDRFFVVANAFERVPSADPGRSIPQMTPFRDYQRQDSLPDRFKSFFEKRVPRNFFVRPSDNLADLPFDQVARHINFVLNYYDRLSPLITIREEEEEGSGEKQPLRYAEGEFPSQFVVPEMDDIVLRLLEVARASRQARFAYLYYYQVFEYAGYYYMDERAKVELRNFLKDPTLIGCSEDKVTELFSILTEVNHNDDVKMKKVIENHCDPSVVWQEIANDLEFFSQEHAMDGGFSLKPLVAKDTTEETWKTMWIPKLFDQFTRIRNSLVHARERRENRVILPTYSNNKLLSRYRPLIARVAEQVALKS